MSKTPAGSSGDKGPVLLLSSRFADWLGSVDACVALTTYQAGRLFFVGRKADGGIRAHERLIEQCQGLWTDGQSRERARRRHWQACHHFVSLAPTSRKTGA